MTAASYKGRVLLGDFSFSAYITDATPTFAVDMLDVTTMVDTSKKYIPGQNTSTFGLKGFLDPDGTANLQYDQINTWTGAEPVSYGPNGLAFGSELWMHHGLQSKSETGATNSSPVSFSVDSQGTGITNQNGVSLHDLTAETATSNSAAYNGGAASTTGARAHLHVTAFSGLTNNIVTIQDSADGTTGWTTIGTFATVTGLTSERLTISGTVRQYVRALWTITGTGTNTFAVGFART